MKVLFVHNNFPGQFKHLARFLALQSGVEVAAIGARTARPVHGVRLIKYALPAVDLAAAHPFARRFELECHRAEQVTYALTTLASSGFHPDVVMVHPGWGEAMPIRTLFPNARIIVYCEFFYGSNGRDVGFDPEFPTIGADGAVALHAKNASTLLAMAEADAGLSPTQWQRSTFPAMLRDKITVLHEGIDTTAVRPDAAASLALASGRVLTARDEVITFVARNLEPLRGYHVFMRALPRIMRERPNAEVLVIGAKGTSYGAQPPASRSWRTIFLEEVADRIDPRRLHFAGHLPYPHYLRALQISSAHVYLTYPFVMSWSLLEAMSSGCLVIGSDTAPVREVLNPRNGVLVPFFDTERIADAVIDALARPEHYRPRRAEARATVVRRYDLHRLCLPALVEFTRGQPARTSVDWGTRPPREALSMADG